MKPANLQEREESVMLCFVLFVYVLTVVDERGGERVRRERALTGDIVET
jgi:hypothetical protein